MSFDRKKDMTKKAPQPSLKKIFDFIEDVKAEFMKVNWTNKEELREYTKVVVMVTLASGLMIYGVDIVIKSVLETINMILAFFG